ncbi:MAG: hypothetical protein LBV27_10180, partial [Oscillospiraceae bacterium]|nr:hypothetical protein [Oscillospiraceae bacterium]
MGPKVGGGYLAPKKMGRPTDDPKPHSLHLRLSDNDLKILNDYCKRTGKTRPDGVRDGDRKST